jgi:hypothetical protein
MARAGVSCPTQLIGIEDRFGESGPPWQLIDAFGLSAEHVAARARTFWNTSGRPRRPQSSSPPFMRDEPRCCVTPPAVDRKEIQHAPDLGAHA